MFGQRCRTSMIKGLVIGASVGIVVGAMATMLGGEKRMRAIERFAKNSCRSFLGKF